MTNTEIYTKIEALRQEYELLTANLRGAVQLREHADDTNNTGLYNACDLYYSYLYNEGNAVLDKIGELQNLL